MSPRSKIVTPTLIPLDSKLLSLNLCNNKLYQLDGLSDIIEKAPKVKTLNLSKNKVRRGSQINFGWRVDGSTHQDNGNRQAEVPVRDYEGWGNSGPTVPGVSLSLALLLQFPPHLS